MKKLELDFLESYDDDSILTELRRIASITGKDSITKEDIERHGRVSYIAIYKRFGSLRSALEKAGLKFQKFTKAVDEELLQILIELWGKTLEKEGRRPFRRDLKIYGFAVSSDTIVRKFGSWKKALRCAFDSVNEKTISAEEDSIELPHTLLEKEITTKSRKAISIQKRFFIFKRDQYTCQICGRSGVGVRLEADHKVSVCDGGTDALYNMWTLCFECNRGKSKTSL